MNEAQARELAVTYVKNQLESIGRDYLDVVEYLDEEGLIDPDEGGKLVAEHIGAVTTEIITVLETGGK